jgi:ectoine hydroxylase-related dioxygenase (phytanoyl-CoA dioxygenase family)
VPTRIAYSRQFEAKTTASMDMRDALTDLGVGQDMISEQERNLLDENGYLALEGVLSADTLARMTARLEELSELEGEDAGKEVHQEDGATRLSDLINKDAMFDICFTHPRVLAGIGHVLRDSFKLSSLNYRAAMPGRGLQALHVDWNSAVEPFNFYVCNSIWLLDDFTAHNGATRVIPGTHLSAQIPREALENPEAAHSDQLILEAPAGTVVIFNSHTWHGGTLNRSAHNRRALHSYFCRRDQSQQLDQRAYVRAETRERLSASARFMLDV